MVIIFTHNNNNINGFDFEKMSQTWFLTKHINTCTVINMSISLTTLYKNHNVDGINCLYKMSLLLFNNPLTIFGI